MSDDDNEKTYVGRKIPVDDDGSALDDTFDAHTVIGFNPNKAAPAAQPQVARAPAAAKAAPAPQPAAPKPAPPAAPRVPATPPASQYSAPQAPEAPPPPPPVSSTAATSMTRAQTPRVPATSPYDALDTPTAANRRPVATRPDDGSASSPFDMPAMPLPPAPVAKPRTSAQQYSAPIQQPVAPQPAPPPVRQPVQQTAQPPAPAASIPVAAPVASPTPIFQPSVPDAPPPQAVQHYQSPHAPAVVQPVMVEYREPGDANYEESEPYYPARRKLPKSALVGAGLVIAAAFVMWLNHRSSSEPAAPAPEHVETAAKTKTKSTHTAQVDPEVTPPPDNGTAPPHLDAILSRYSKAFAQAQSQVRNPASQ